MLDPGRLHTSVSVGDSIPERCVGGVGDGQLIGGDGETLLESLAVLAGAIVGVHRFIELSSGVCSQTVEPDRRFASHALLPTGSGCRLLSTGVEWTLRSEGTALGGGGDVGPVGGDDAFEDVACLGDVVGVGDDEDEVLVSAAGHRHVQASSGGGRGGEGDAGGVGGGLVPGFGRCVPEADMLADVVGGQGDSTVPVDPGDGQLPGVADVR